MPDPATHDDMLDLFDAMRCAVMKCTCAPNGAEGSCEACVMVWHLARELVDLGATDPDVLERASRRRQRRRGW
jgi:hypothetical protein